MGGQNVTILNNNTFLKINDEIRKKGNTKTQTPNKIYLSIYVKLTALFSMSTRLI